VTSTDGGIWNVQTASLESQIICPAAIAALANAAESVAQIAAK
jgi:hypothetical protein